MKTLTTDMYLSERELLLLKDELRVLNLVRPRDALLIEVTLETGARESEVIAIEHHHLNYETKSVFIDTIKGGEKRDVPFLDEALFERLWNYSKSIKGPIFPITDSRVRQIWYEVRPPQIRKSFHKLRHTFGRTRSIQYKRDIYILKYLLGHKSIANTELYTRLDYDPQSLREMLNAKLSTAN